MAIWKSLKFGLGKTEFRFLLIGCTDIHANGSSSQELLVSEQLMQRLRDQTEQYDSDQVHASTSNQKIDYIAWKVLQVENS